MLDDEDSQRLPDDAEALRDIREQAREVRRQYHNQKIRDGSVTDDLRTSMAEVAIAYRDLLIDYRDEDAYEPEWGERSVDWIVGLLNEQVTRRQPRPGRGRGAETTTVPKAVVVPAKDLYDVLKEMDEMWRQLGLGLSVESSHRTEIDDELIERVEEWRQQNLEA
jgi:hypothetical protein